tara:strand:+ start:1209 stop:1556 length:348 start_codon:yes stop_codon:yes gene_type:complete
MINLAKYLLWEFQEESKQKSIKYYRSHGAYGYVIWLTVILEYLKKKPITIDELVLAATKHASRRTVVDFIKDATEAGYLIKKVSSEDRRKVFIEPSAITISDYSEWSSSFISNIT